MNGEYIIIDKGDYELRYKILSNEEFENLKNDYILKNILFPSIDDALEYTNDVIKDRDLLIKYQAVDVDFEETEVAKDLLEKINIVIKEYNSFPQTLLEKLKEQKSKSKSCSNCESSINKEFFIKRIEDRMLENEKIEDRIKEFNCPICDNEDYTMNEADKKKLDSFENKINISKSNYEIEEVKHQSLNKKITYMYISKNFKE